MKEVYEQIFVGNENDCFSNSKGWAVVHACKYPCHRGRIGYERSLSSNHPNYLVLEEENNLYLNIIDPPYPLFKLELFTSFMDFAIKHDTMNHNILIHCNQGESRAPSLALLFMAKYFDVINNDSYQHAKADFISYYNAYYPGNGIQIFLSEHWKEIDYYLCNFEMKPAG